MHRWLTCNFDNSGFSPPWNSLSSFPALEQRVINFRTLESLRDSMKRFHAFHTAISDKSSPDSQNPVVVSLTFEYFLGPYALRASMEIDDPYPFVSLCKYVQVDCLSLTG